MRMNPACRIGLLVLALGLWPVAVLQAAAPAEDRAALFARALAAARAGQWEALDTAEKQLGDDFPLQGYLDYHRLRARLPEASAREVRAYLRKYAASPLADSMRRQAIERYGQARRWEALLDTSPDEPASTSLRCYYYQALLGEDPGRAQQAGRQLWLHGESLPPACDALFASLRASGHIDDRLVWQRMVLAYRSGSPGLMRYLRSELKDPAWQLSAEKLLHLYQHPAQAKDLIAGLGHPEMATAALHRLAEKDPVQAVALLPALGTLFSLAEDEQAAIRYRAAWFSSLRALPDNRAWLDGYLAQSADVPLLEHRIRRAVTEQDWPAVERWITQLPAGQDSGRWQYWRARSLESRQQLAAAEPYFRQAAGERSFWGFLAAQRLGQAPALNNQGLPPQGLPPLDDDTRALLERVGLLLAAGERGHAREEWLFHLRRETDPLQQEALAAAAVQQGWPHLAIDAALQAGQHDKLDWRFPLAYDSQFAAAEAQYQVDRWLLMALARRESSFNALATSPVGAQGLMQLMPGTARQVARQAGIAYSGTDALLDPATNIALGSHYLAGLLQRYQGNRVLALAAYNAGPNRVDRWLQDANAPMDVFIESIPFYETREYVQAVLAYRVILSRHRSGEPLLAVLDDTEIIPPYSPLLLAQAGSNGSLLR